MMQNRDSYAAAGHAEHRADHDWGDPVPGAGNFRVCRRCGAKETPGSKRTACDGLQGPGVTPTEHDYDPI